MATKRWGMGTETLTSYKLVYRKKKKVIYIDRKRNPDGEFFKITEACGGKRDTVVIPDVLMDQFILGCQKVKGGKINGDRS